MSTGRPGEPAGGGVSRRGFIRSVGGCVAGSALVTMLSPLATATPRADMNDDATAEWPSYLPLHRSGVLRERARRLWELMRECALCPRECGARRLDGQRGFCRAPGTRLIISGHSPHFGEERPLVGRHGSGTIFFSHCNLRCVFCQNWEISHLGRGGETTIEDLADMMLDLQRRGCHNINVVTPTHYAPHILMALDRAAARGLRIPIVYNTCGWEKESILRMLDGIVDIYLPDIKYADPRTAAKYSAGAATYPETTQKAILEMHRQVGVARTPPDGIMRRGLMIRHLVMPNHVGESIRILEWIAENLPKDTYLNIMPQYYPAYKAFDYPEIARRITSAEYERVLHRAQELGFTNLDSRNRPRW